MQRDLNAIELPPPTPDYGRPAGDDITEDPAEMGNQPIDNLDLGTDPEQLGAPGQGVKVEDEPDRPGIEQRGPVPEPPDRDDPEAMARSRDAKAGDADPSATRTEGMPIDQTGRPADRDPSAG